MPPSLLDINNRNETTHSSTEDVLTKIVGGVSRPLVALLVLGIGTALWSISRIAQRCNCRKQSDNWSRVFSKCIEGKQLHYKVCLKHGTERPYSMDEMRFLTRREERTRIATMTHAVSPVA